MIKVLVLVRLYRKDIIDGDSLESIVKAMLLKHPLKRDVYFDDLDLLIHANGSIDRDPAQAGGALELASVKK